MKVCLVAALMLVAVQSPNVSGSWALQAPAASGRNFQLGAQSGTLTLAQKGDAVTGTWQGRMPEPWQLTGSVKGSTFEFQTETRGVPAVRNGEPTMVERHWVFRGTVEGDKMSGTMQLTGGDGELPSQSFTASRKR